MKNGLFGLFSLWVLTSLVATAAPKARVCVRNYGDDAGNPCERMPKTYTYVTFARDASDADEAFYEATALPPELEDAQMACTRMYDESFCDLTKEYKRVTARDGRTICVLENDQPGVANLCKSTPQFYAYVLVDGKKP